MAIELGRLGDAIATIDGEDTLKDMMAKVGADFGYAGFAYLSRGAQTAIVITNYTEPWQRRYFEAGYDKLDPTIALAKARMSAFAWDVDVNSKHATPEIKRFWNEAADHGVRSGFTIPVPGSYGRMSMLTFASPDPNPAPKCDFNTVTAAAIVGQLHGRIEALKVAPIHGGRFLRPKEKIYLRWAAEGKPMEEIAAMLGIKYNSVRSTLETVKERFGAKNLAHLVALALRYGLMD